jgi:hypothetical protein
MPGVDAARAVAGLRELKRLTGDENGAQRVAWTDTWISSRESPASPSSATRPATHGRPRRARPTAS